MNVVDLRELNILLFRWRIQLPQLQLVVKNDYPGNGFSRIGALTIGLRPFQPGKFIFHWLKPETIDSTKCKQTKARPIFFMQRH